MSSAGPRQNSAMDLYPSFENDSAQFETNGPDLPLHVSSDDSKCNVSNGGHPSRGAAIRVCKVHWIIVS